MYIFGSEFKNPALVKSVFDSKIYVAHLNKENEYEGSAIEMRAMLELRHKNIVCMKESFWHPTFDCFVMINQFCEYGNLGNQIRDRISAHS